MPVQVLVEQGHALPGVTFNQKVWRSCSFPPHGGLGLLPWPLLQGPASEHDQPLNWIGAAQCSALVPLDSPRELRHWAAAVLMFAGSALHRRACGPAGGWGTGGHARSGGCVWGGRSAAAALPSEAVERAAGGARRRPRVAGHLHRHCTQVGAEPAAVSLCCGRWWAASLPWSLARPACPRVRAEATSAGSLPDQKPAASASCTTYLPWSSIGCWQSSPPSWRSWRRSLSGEPGLPPLLPWLELLAGGFGCLQAELACPGLVLGATGSQSEPPCCAHLAPATRYLGQVERMGQRKREGTSPLADGLGKPNWQGAWLSLGGLRRGPEPDPPPQGRDPAPLRTRLTRLRLMSSPGWFSMSDLADQLSSRRMVALPQPPSEQQQQAEEGTSGPLPPRPGAPPGMGGSP